MGSPSTQCRVVITGLGVVTPLGNQLEDFWNKLVAGQCGIDRISAFDATPFDTQIAGEVKNFDPTPAFPSPKEIRHTDRFSQFGVFAAHHALLDSGLELTGKIATKSASSSAPASAAWPPPSSSTKSCSTAVPTGFRRS